MIKITRLFKDFTESERSAGFVLLFTTIISMILANTGPGEALVHFFHTEWGPVFPGVDLRLSVEHWVNDGLMTIFFLMVGLEIERELYAGELSTLSNASLPLLAALGGMVVPFLVHFTINYGLPTQRGAGIPMATDIAFALGILSLARGVPYGLKVFLTAFAIIDDLGAILVIAFFYTDDLNTNYLLAAAGIFALLFALNRLKVYMVLPYILLGLALWFCFLQSGVHATLAGVLLAFAMPFGNGDENSLSYRVQHWLHKPVAFIILPIFALVNTAIVIPDNWLQGLGQPNALGIMAGLLVGKPLGILVCCLIGVRLGWSTLPKGVNWYWLAGASVLGGIGFTMSIFITLLAFSDPGIITGAKLAILVSSATAALIGLFLMGIARKKIKQEAAEG